MGDRGRVQGGRGGRGGLREQGPGGHPGRLGEQDRAERGGQQQRQGQEEEAEGSGEEAEGRVEEEDPDRRGEVGARGPDPRAEGEAGGEEGGVRAWQLLKAGSAAAEKRIPESGGAFLADRTTHARSAWRDCPSPGRARKPLWRVACSVCLVCSALV